MNKKFLFTKVMLIVSLILMASLLLGACKQTPTPQAPAESEVQPETESEDTAPVEADPVEPTATATPEPPPTEVPPPTLTPTPEIVLSDLSPDAQRIEFQAEDGKNLVGYYYPSKYANAPVIIFDHWAGGDQRDWCRMAPWLQNRLDENPVGMPMCPESAGGVAPWWDPSWFPVLEEGASFAIFTFDFRDFGESEAGLGSPENWAKDALAAFVTAAGMEGVDPTRMVSAGASIGADGSPDGCYLYNMLGAAGCLGAFSWSPGSYLKMIYATVVKDLKDADPTVPVWCLAGEQDGSSSDTCESAAEDLDRMILYPGTSAHGMTLVDPEIAPNSLELFLEFIALTLGFK